MTARQWARLIGPEARERLRRGLAVLVIALVAIVPVGASAAIVAPAAALDSVLAADREGAAGPRSGAVPGVGAEGSGSGEPSAESAVAGSVAAWDSCGVVVASGGPAPASSAPCAMSEPGIVAGSLVGAGTVFAAGNIISDAVFYNPAALSDEQIGKFLAAYGAGCRGAFCLRDVRVDSVDQPADEFCAAVAGGVAESAAVVIGKLSRACGVNPQVMLTTLQKESGLVGSPGPSASVYDAAWGWHCPDTGPGGTANCDPEYAGFFNQAYGMAKQWSRYRVHPERYKYRAGQTVQILWNVAESGCGSAPVTIANTATAALYNYTPYQPNAAALAAYPGAGDACSSYGNRNFFFLFGGYFGGTGGGASSVAGVGSTAVTIPVNRYVAAGMAGRTITAPSGAVAAGLIAGFAALGVPYVWGGGGSGTGPDNGCARGGGQFNSCGSEVGFDCSGLTAYVLGRAGFAVPGDSVGQRRQGGIQIGWDRALPGDIVGFPGHVAVYLGSVDGVRYILEASWVGYPVHIVPLTRTDVDPTVHRYWAGIPDIRTSPVGTVGPANPRLEPYKAVTNDGPTAPARTYSAEMPYARPVNVVTTAPPASSPVETSGGLATQPGGPATTVTSQASSIPASNNSGQMAPTSTLPSPTVSTMLPTTASGSAPGSPTVADPTTSSLPVPTSPQTSTPGSPPAVPNPGACVIASTEPTPPAVATIPLVPPLTEPPTVIDTAATILMMAVTTATAGVVDFGMQDPGTAPAPCA